MTTPNNLDALREKLEREIKQMASSVSDTQHRLENDEFAYTTARLRDDKDIDMTLDKILALTEADKQQAIADRLQMVLDELNKPSGLNTDFDRGYDKALKHVRQDITAIISKVRETK